MFKATIGEDEYEVESKNNELIIDGAAIDWDLSILSEGNFHIVYNHKSYNAEILSIDTSDKTVEIKINNRKYIVALQDKLDLLLDRLGMNEMTSATLNDIKAPMPGLILEIQVEAGDEVKAGDPIMILEAMKMENVLKSPGEGIVKSVVVAKGDSVEKNQVLVQF